MKGEELFLESLPIGRANAITASEIQWQTGFDRRYIRLLVNDLRKQGVLIATGDYGYFRVDPDDPEDREELMHTLNRMEAQARDMFITSSTQKEALQQLSMKF